MKHTIYLFAIVSALFSSNGFAAPTLWGYCESAQTPLCRTVQEPGRCQVRFLKSDMAADDAGEYVYKVQYNDGCGWLLRKIGTIPGIVGVAQMYPHYLKTKMTPCMRCGVERAPENQAQ